MFKEFLMKKMLKSQLKDMSPADQEKVLAIVEKNPDLFMNIAKEVQERVGKGEDQTMATMAVMKAHEFELKAITGK